MNAKRNIGNIKQTDKNKYVLRISCGFDDFGKRIQLTRTIEAKSNRDAEAQLLKFYNEKESLKQFKVSKSPETLGELYDEWLENHVKPNLRNSTAVFYNTMRNHIEPYIKSKIKSFIPKMVNKIINSFDSSRVRKGVYTLLNAMFNHAIKWGYMISNPCKLVDTPQYKAKEKEAYTENELSFAMSVISKEPVKFQTFFYFAILCGMRRGEILGLNWDDINFDTKEFEIKRSATHKKGIGTVCDKTKNVTSMRRLELPTALIPLLNSIKIQQAEQKLKMGSYWCSEGWIFTKDNGTIMSVDMPDHWWSRLKSIYPDKFPQKTLHTLRHTFATYLINSNVPLSTVSKALGHAQQSTTLNIYSHVIEDSKRAAIESQESHIMSLKREV